MKYLNFSIFSTPTGSSIISDLISWNSSLLGKFAPYPLGTDALALHRSPYQWDPKYPFSILIYDKAEETFKFQNSAGITNCKLPLSSFSFSTQNGFTCTPRNNQFGFYFDSHLFKLLLPFINFNLDDQEIKMGDSQKYIKIQPHQIDFTYPNNSVSNSFISRSKIGFTSGSSISNTGFSYSDSSTANPIYLPLVNKMGEMSLYNRVVVLDQFSFFGYRDVYGTVWSYNATTVELKMGGAQEKSVFTFDDKFSFPDDNAFYEIGAVKANLIGFKRLTAGGGILDVIFNGSKLNFKTTAELSNIKFQYERSDSTKLFNTWAEMFTSSENVTKFYEGDIKNFNELLAYGFSHPTENKTYFKFILKGSGNTGINFETAKFYLRFFLKRNGEELTIKMKVETLNYSKTGLVVQSTALTDTVYKWNYRDIKEGNAQNPAKMVHFFKFKKYTGTETELSIQRKNIPLSFSISAADKVYFEIGDTRKYFFETHRMGVIPPVQTDIIPGYFSSFTSLYLPQNISSFDMKTGEALPDVTSLVIPYTSMEKRGSIQALFANSSFSKFQNLLSGIFIFNINHLIPSGTILPDYENDLTITYSNRNWVPASGCFANMGTLGQTIPIFLASDSLFESKIPDYSLLLSNAALGSKATINYIRWQTTTFADCFNVSFVIRLMRNDTDLNHITTSQYDRYWMAIDDTTVYSMQTTNEMEENEQRGGTIRELLEDSADFSFVAGAPVEIIGTSFHIYPLTLFFSSWSHHIISP